jgi:hypothetical protein
MSLLKPHYLLIPLLLCFFLSSCDIWGKPPTGFSLAKNPVDLTLEQGESKTVDVEVVRSGGFKDEINISVESTVLTALPITIPAGSSRGTLRVTAKADAAPGESTAKMTGSSGKLTNSSDLPVSITKKAFRVAATVPNYSAGEAAIKAQLIGVNEPESRRYIVGQGSMKADGSFTLLLEDVPPQYVDVPELGLSVECSNVVPTPTTFKSVGLLEIELEQNGTPLGFLFQASSTEFLGDFFSSPPTGVTGKLAFFVYSDAAAQMKGNCSDPIPPITYPQR